MDFDADRTHAGPAAAVRNTEGLMQIEMADIGAVIAGPRQADLRVEISAIQIDLPSVCMDEVANGPDRTLEYAMRRRVGNHHRRQAIGKFFRLSAQISQIHIAVRIATDGNYIHSGHV